MITSLQRRKRNGSAIFLQDSKVRYYKNIAAKSLNYFYIDHIEIELIIIGTKIIS